LVARRITTVISEALILKQSGGKAAGGGLSAATSPVVRNFSVSVIMMIHVPLAFKKDENFKASFDVVKKLEEKIRESLN
jgi:hypothetical protein